MGVIVERDIIVMYMGCLPHAVSAVDQQVVTSHVGAGITAQVDVGALELLGLAMAAHGDHRQPQVLGLLVDKVRQAGVDVSGGNAVHASKVAPLIGQRPCHMDTASLCNVVGSLLLGEIGDVAGHGGGNHEASSAALLEVSTNGLGAMESAREVGLNHLFPVLHGSVENTTAGGAAGVGDEGVNLSKVLDDRVDKVLHTFPVAHITLVGLDLDAVFFAELLGVLLAALRSRRIGDGQIGAHLGASASSFDAHATGAGGSGDRDDLALQAKEVIEVFGLGNGDRHGDGDAESIACVFGWRRMRSVEGKDRMDRIDRDGEVIFEVGAKGAIYVRKATPAPFSPPPLWALLAMT